VNNGGWARLAGNLKAEIDEERIQAYRGTVSLPFEPGQHKRVVVKIVDDRGIESLKIGRARKRGRSQVVADCGHLIEDRGARVRKRKRALAAVRPRVYTKSMARRSSATVRLTRDDARALERARSLGVSPSDLIRQGLRLAAAPYYRTGSRRPKTRLFVSTDPHLGEESHLFQEREAD